MLPFVVAWMPECLVNMHETVSLGQVAWIWIWMCMYVCVYVDIVALCAL